MVSNGGWREATTVLVLLPVLTSGALTGAGPGPSAAPAVPGVKAPAQEFDAARQRLVDRLREQGIDDEAVLEAVGEVPRHEFVPERFSSRAYDNRALPIGSGQTISQPYVVALMTALLRVGEGDRVFEVGTGSGYQAAILAELGCTVYTIEIVPDLAASAARRLERLGYDRVHVREGDGYHGWPEEAPFDGVVVTAAPEKIPDPLVQQLRVGGRLVIPVGPQAGYQYLTLVQKLPGGEVRTERVIPVRFVPFVREPGALDTGGPAGEPGARHELARRP